VVVFLALNPSIPMHPELHFPQPPFRLVASLIDSPPPSSVLSEYVRQIRAWRAAVLALVHRPLPDVVADNEALSEPVREWLGQLLAGEWPDEVRRWALQSPYHLTPFPTGVLEPAAAASLDSALGVLRWRAGVEDFLSDIWDVIGEPLLDLDECNAIGAFFRPITQERICGFCLTEFPPDQLHVDRHGCLVLAHVRAKWPPMPGKFVQWAREAEQA